MWEDFRRDEVAPWLVDEVNRQDELTVDEFIIEFQPEIDLLAAMFGVDPNPRLVFGPWLKLCVILAPIFRLHGVGYVRPMMAHAAKIGEFELRENDHKPEFPAYYPQLDELLKEETGELLRAVEIDEFISEAGDVIAVAAMIINKVRGEKACTDRGRKQP